MGDSQDDNSFEVDGVAVDYAGPGQPSDEDLVTDEEEDGGLVIDSAGPSDDIKLGRAVELESTDEVSQEATLKEKNGNEPEEKSPQTEVLCSFFAVE